MSSKSSSKKVGGARVVGGDSTTIVNNLLGEQQHSINDLYELEETIGKGHYAVVKLGKHKFTGEQVAIKCIDKDKLDPVSRDHLYQEVRCMKLVQHPNVVRLYDVCDTRHKLYLILELGDGGDMYDYIMKHGDHGGLPEGEAKRYFRQIVRALKYCHDLRVVHRDLKPENVVFFAQTGQVKLTDFGFSNVFEPGIKLLTSCGSLAYSAPEILLGDSYDAPPVDIWSLGVILYMLVTGRAPFQEQNDSETLTMILDCKYYLPPYLSSSCIQLIRSMLVRDPGSRIRLDDIVQHEWLRPKRSRKRVSQSNENNRSESEVDSDEDDDDDYEDQENYLVPLVKKEHLNVEDNEKIFDQMIKGKVAKTRQEILKTLDEEPYNYVSATYYLLAERLLKSRLILNKTHMAKKRSSVKKRKMAETARQVVYYTSPANSLQPMSRNKMLFRQDTGVEEEEELEEDEEDEIGPASLSPNDNTNIDDVLDLNVPSMGPPLMNIIEDEEQESGGAESLVSGVMIGPVSNPTTIAPLSRKSSRSGQENNTLASLTILEEVAESDQQQQLSPHNIDTLINKIVEEEDLAQVPQSTDSQNHQVVSTAAAGSLSSSRRNSTASMRRQSQNSYSSGGASGSVPVMPSLITKSNYHSHSHHNNHHNPALLSTQSSSSTEQPPLSTVNTSLELALDNIDSDYENASINPAHNQSIITSTGSTRSRNQRLKNSVNKSNGSTSSSGGPPQRPLSESHASVSQAYMMQLKEDMSDSGGGSNNRLLSQPHPVVPSRARSLVHNRNNTDSTDAIINSLNSTPLPASYQKTLSIEQPNASHKGLSIEHRMANMSQMSISSTVSQLSKTNSFRGGNRGSIHAGGGGGGGGSGSNSGHRNSTALLTGGLDGPAQSQGTHAPLSSTLSSSTTTPRESTVFHVGNRSGSNDEKPYVRILLGASQQSLANIGHQGSVKNSNRLVNGVLGSNHQILLSQLGKNTPHTSSLNIDTSMNNKDDEDDEDEHTIKLSDRSNGASPGSAINHSSIKHQKSIDNSMLFSASSSRNQLISNDKSPRSNNSTMTRSITGGKKESTSGQQTRSSTLEKQKGAQSASKQHSDETMNENMTLTERKLNNMTISSTTSSSILSKYMVRKSKKLELDKQPNEDINSESSNIKANSAYENEKTDESELDKKKRQRKKKSGCSKCCAVV